MRLLVIGDVVLDEYVWGEVDRISPEAPVPVVHVRDETLVLGGAANVARNVIALGGTADNGTRPGQRDNRNALPAETTPAGAVSRR